MSEQLKLPCTEWTCTICDVVLLKHVHFYHGMFTPDTQSIISHMWTHVKISEYYVDGDGNKPEE